jgi:hypothetical protein
MLFRKPYNMTVRELFDPMSRLPHSVLNGDSEARAMSIMVKDVSFRTFFRGKGGIIVNKLGI